MSSSRARLSALLGQRRGMIATLSVSSVIAGLAEAAMLVVLAQIAATLVNKQKDIPLKIAGLDFHATVGTLFGVALAFALVRLVLQAGPLSILPARIGADVQAKLRVDVMHAYTRASWEVQSRDREGHMQEIMTSQVLQASQGAQQATTLLTSSFTFLILMISAIALNARAAGLVLFAALLLFAAMRPLNKLGVRKVRQLSRAQLDYAGGVSETVRLAEETNVFGVGAAQRDRIDHLIAVARDLYLRTQTIMRLTPNLYQSLMYLMLIGGLAALYAVNRHDVAALGGVILLLVRAGTNGQQIQGAYQGLRQSLPFIERIQDAAERYGKSTPVTGKRQLDSVERLAFDRVSFSYRVGSPVLSDVSFQVDGGEAVGIVGPSGAGKSTIVQILLALRAPAGGRYLVNGLRADEFATEDWHRRVVYVPQEPRLVHATVAENIRYFRADIDDDAVERAARLARIHEDVMGWADGYETIVGPRADAVSGGQQQRICLARALVVKPDVLVLDEPTSALDPHSEALIQESLAGLKGELTMFIIAHRMSTLDVCDRVMVIDEGQLAAFDTVEHLRRENAYYRSAMGLAASASAGASPRAETGEATDRKAAAGTARSNGAHAASRRIPDFFIVGHQKCGTTALWEMLRGHPGIFMPDQKEPRFLAPDLASRFGQPRGEWTPQRRPRTLDQYLSLFAPAGPEQRAGEASPQYLRSSVAASRIAELAPDARIIAILREPASFLRSLHSQLVSANVETERDFRKALKLEDVRRRGNEIPRRCHHPESLLYCQHVRYAEQLRRFHTAFSPEQVLVLVYDDLRRDNEAVVRQILRFLDVDDAFPIETLQTKPVQTVRSLALHHFVADVRAARDRPAAASRSSRVANTLIPARLRSSERVRRAWQRALYTAPQAADPQLMAELRRRFKSEVAALSEYLDRDLLTLWGYHDVG